MQFLLQQSLLAHGEEGGGRRRGEGAGREGGSEVKELEVARRDGFRPSPNLSDLERTACALVAHFRGSQEEEGEEEEE